nr:CotH kinase family protein [Bacteroidaceae bacterium]
MVSNLDQFVDPSWNYGAWAEIYNATESDLQLRGYWISIDQSKLKMVRITQSTIVPKGGYKTLWFEHHDKYCLSQLDLKLDPEGGELYLSNSSGVIVASVAYPPIPPRSSYAQTSDGKNEWMLSSTPTPGKQNVGMTFCTERLSAPVITKESQIFSNSMVFSVGIPTGCILRYTTDGSTPTLKNGSTSTNGYFNLNSTKVYRFALFREGYLSSPVVTRTFILKDKNFSLPIISVVTAPQNLYSDTLGIFVKGTKGRAGRGQSSRCNWNMEWDRPCNFEFLDAEGHSLVNQEAEMKRCGGWSRAYTPYSFKIHAVKNYEDKKTLDYPFFDAKPYLKHKVLQIRNGGNDYSCRVKDAFLQQVVATSGLDIDYQEYTPVVHYINGVYKGVINMREPSNKQHVYANYGLDEDEIDLFEMDPDSGYVQMCGNKDAWKTLYSYSRLAVIDSYYQKVCEMIDVDEFCNYLAVELYLGSTDWPQNNLKAFRPIADGGRFRFILYDLDHSFNTTSPFSTFAGKKTYTFNTLYGEAVSNYTKEIEVVTIFLNLLNNPTFRKKFIDTFCLVAGSVFEPTRCEEIMKQLATRVYDMQMLPDNGYGANVSPWGTTNTLISSLASRQATLIQALQSYAGMRLSSITGQQVSLSSNLSTAKLQVNDIVVPTGKFSGTLFPPVTLKASAPQGYRFLGWYRSDEAGTDTQKLLVEKGSTWAYYDRGALGGTSWTQPEYDDRSWSRGAAPLGYSNVQTFATKISYGSDSSQKHPAYYFRQTFHIDDMSDEDVRFVLNYSLDDGMVVYVNGTEAARYNMPSGAITGKTFSTTYAGDAPFTGTIDLDRSLFHAGDNLIAVEVHNTSYTSSDIYWDASLMMQLPFQYDEDMEYLSTDPVMVMPTSTAPLRLVACFTRQTDAEGKPVPGKPVVINEVSAGNSRYVNEYFKKNDWVELYNLSGDDFELEGCYLSDDLQNPLKYCITASGTKADTKIPAHGYKIIWCDKLPTDSQLHADFKLENSEGSLVILTASDLSWSDTLVYCAHDGIQSVGRFPDGGDSLYVMPHPTIAHENMLSSYATRWEPTTTDPDGIDFK